MSLQALLAKSQSLIVAIFCTLVPATVWSQVHLAEQHQAAVAENRFQEVSHFADRLVSSGEVAGVVVLVARNGKIDLQRAVGLAERVPQRPMKVDTIFRIASMTKPITSVGIMLLEQDGELKLSDPVSKHIPELGQLSVFSEEKNHFAKKNITIRHLLTHTSGMVYDDAPGLGDLYRRAGIESGVNRTALNLEENISRLAKLPLMFEPGERFNYGISTDVLGLVIERVAKMPLDKFIHERICMPLGMNDTFFHVPTEKRRRLAATFVQEGQQLRELSDCERIRNAMFSVRMSPDHATDETHQYLSGGGGLCSTAADYFRFCQMILDEGKYSGGVLLKPESVARMTENQIGDMEAGKVGDISYTFGYGFAVFPNVEGRNREIGWGGVWGTGFWISLKDDWVAIIMTQRVFDQSYFDREIEFTRLVREGSK